MKNSLVSIGIPVYNEALFILDTVESAMNQTYDNIEIIISDNCSTDFSLKVIHEIVQQNSNIRLINQPVNIGAVGNFDFLKNEANGKYFMWLGAHDIISKNYIENSIKVLEENSSIVMAYHNAAFFSGELNLENLQGDAGSYIDTMGYSQAIDRMHKVVSKLSYCTAIHGVFRTEVLRSINIKKDIIGPDNLVLFETAAFGHIKRINKIAYFRRTMHVKEDQDQKMKRYQKYKLIEKINSKPINALAEHHILFLMSTEKLTFLDKLNLIRDVIALFYRQYNVSRTLMIRQTFRSFIFAKKM